VLAAPPAEAPDKTETRHLTIVTSTAPGVVRPGSRVLLYADVLLKSRMHVYAPAPQQDYIPIQLTLAPGGAVRAGKPRYPPAERFFFEPLNETQRVYSRPFRITQPVTISPTAAGGSLVVEGTVKYQACDDAICYVPQDVPVRWRLAVAAGVRR
jgi:DsbC/DsbD-like thiol-disulfide interchange protein